MTSPIIENVEIGEEQLPTFFSTVILGGFVAGNLDALDGVVAFGLVNGQNPIKVLQYIASGAIGASSFDGGLATALLGMVLHFFIAFVVAAIYYFASLRIPVLYQQAITLGLLFGAAVFLVMNYVVLPFSNVPEGKFSWILFINGIVGHALFVGLPISLFAKYSAVITNFLGKYFKKGEILETSSSQ